MRKIVKAALGLLLVLVVAAVAGWFSLDKETRGLLATLPTNTDLLFWNQKQRDAAFRALDADEAVRVVVLAGRGKSFSAGADLNWMKAAGAASVEENLADARKLAGMLRTIAELSKPTIARVHGAALGGGMGLASACDICVAGDKAVFATSEVRFGIIPSAISPYVIRAIGERQAYRYFQTAERISAARACPKTVSAVCAASTRICWAKN